MKFIIESNSLGVEAAKALAQAITISKTLEVLDLCKRSLKFEAFREQWDWIGGLLGVNREFENFDFNERA